MTREPEAGFVTLEHVLAVALALVLMVGLTNLVLVQYARGVVRTALDDAARAGARALTSPEHAVAVCLGTAEQVHADLLPGTLGDGIEVDCTSDGAVVRATATAVYPSWLPGVPAWQTSDESVVAWEGTR